jgi:hypothetical protein
MMWVVDTGTLRPEARNNVRHPAGIVLYDAEYVLPFGEGLLAVPLSALCGSQTKEC